jgi:hypothetical protein
MSVQTKNLIERWQEFRDVAIAEACIQYHESLRHASNTTSGC